MHTVDLDLSMEEICKVEGAAALDLKIRGGKVEDVKFKITEYKRFFTEAMKGKPYIAVPQLLARICGTCSNAHILASIEACEEALEIVPSHQTKLLRLLTVHGLMIRDHALHLYLFSLPDIYDKDAFLDFDENDPVQHQLLHDGFDLKGAGNMLANLVAGRSVHGTYPTIGGFTHFPDQKGVEEAIKKLQVVRPAALRLIKEFEKAPFHFDRKTKFMGVVSEHYSFLHGPIHTSDGEVIVHKHFGDHLKHVALTYSQASAYHYKGESYMVGALARMNLAKDRLNKKTQADIGETLKKFPSTDIFHNNLAQAIEVLHCIDDAISILSSHSFVPEPVVKAAPKQSMGVGVIEAPRGTLYHLIHLNADGTVRDGEIVVPTGQNQTNIEEDIMQLVQGLLLDTTKEKIQFEIEKLIRAYDPCMSCGAHFLKVNWQ